ncbi:hypothetical protein DEE93_02830 [Ralstonia pickettii]|uniref:Transmembrane protein n=2 Tax=Burkholderiaceae TaxID=119060 RepID=A0A9Q2H014_RALPI|nr:hypothetical protein [Ralstonia pickettii]MBA9849462.1 hypothetical protein [Ralstonia pickettii]MBA9875938.1 hypothetical protein [Ralstonia pickettii]MBA9881246.1 hypothetical protein [Ralstonia pickettii]MBA9885821.1 hypothetical protein [Ralstonia pickettii]
MAPFITEWYRRWGRCVRYICAAVWITFAGMAPWSLTGAAPKFAYPVTQRVDASASLALPRTWGPLRLTSETPIPSIAATINSPFGPSRLVFAQQTVAPESFALVTVRKSDFDKGTPDYLETLRPRDLAILLNHMESRVHGDRPAWAARLVRGKAPALQVLAGRRVLYWEGEWSTSAARTVVVRGYAFFGNGAVYLLRIFGTASGSEPVEFAEEARFADLVAATFHTK